MNVATFPRLLRCDQWIKNLFVLAPAFFGGVLLDSSLWRGLVVAFFAFSLLSSSIYIVNDIVDLSLIHIYIVYGMSHGYFLKSGLL